MTEIAIASKMKSFTGLGLNVSRSVKTGFTGIQRGEVGQKN